MPLANIYLIMIEVDFFKRCQHLIKTDPAHELLKWVPAVLLGCRKSGVFLLGGGWAPALHASFVPRHPSAFLAVTPQLTAPPGHCSQPHGRGLIYLHVSCICLLSNKITFPEIQVELWVVNKLRCDEHEKTRLFLIWKENRNGVGVATRAL